MTVPTPLIPERSSRAPKILVAVSVLLLLGAGLAVVQGARMIGSGISEAVSSLTSTRADLLTEVESPGEGSVTLDAGTYVVVAIGQDLLQRVDEFEPTTAPPDSTPTDPTNGYRRTRFRSPTVTVTDPAGAPVPVTGPSLEFFLSDAGIDLVPIKSFRVTRPGRYRVTAADGSERVDTIGIGRRTSFSSEPVEKASKGGLLIVVSIGMFLLSVGGLIGGAIWWANSGSPRPPGPAAGWGPPAGPPGGSGYGPGAAGYGRPPGYGPPPGGGWGTPGAPPPPPPPT